MKRAVWVALGTSALITGAAAISIDAASNNVARTLTRVEYDSALAAIDAARPAVLARCEALPVADREGCRIRMETDENARVAQLDLTFRRDRESARRAQRALIEARYQVERAKCSALAGSRRDRCFIDAHAQKGRAMLEAATPYSMRS